MSDDRQSFVEELAGLPEGTRRAIFQPTPDDDSYYEPIDHRLSDAAEIICALGEEKTKLCDEIAELKQAVWDAYAILGFDTDGDPTPGALTYPLFPEFVRQFATEARADYDAACEEISEAVRDAVEQARRREEWSDLYVAAETELIELRAALAGGESR